MISPPDSSSNSMDGHRPHPHERPASIVAASTFQRSLSTAETTPSVLPRAIIAASMRRSASVRLRDTAAFSRRS